MYFPAFQGFFARGRTCLLGRIVPAGADGPRHQVREGDLVPLTRLQSPPSHGGRAVLSTRTFDGVPDVVFGFCDFYSFLLPRLCRKQTNTRPRTFPDTGPRARGAALREAEALSLPSRREGGLGSSARAQPAALSGYTALRRRPEPGAHWSRAG